MRSFQSSHAIAGLCLFGALLAGSGPTTVARPAHATGAIETARCRTSAPGLTESAGGPGHASNTSEDYAAVSGADDYAAVARDIAYTWIEKNPPQSMDWNWEEAVLGLGVQAVHQATAEEPLLDYLQNWIDYHITRGIRINRNDAVVPATSALYLYDVLDDPGYLEPVAQAESYLAEDAPRLDDGAIAHTLVTPNQIWIDSLFMFGTFYTMDGAIAGAAWAFDALAEQYSLFASHMLSSDLGLYWHMYDELIDQHIPVTPTFWGRGNGWALSSLALLLTELPTDHPSRPALEASFRAHAAAVMAWQDPSGLWWTVVNRPGESYLETSASALFTFSLLRGAHLGILGDDALQAGELGLVGLLSRIEYDENGDPIVTGNSRSTNPGPYWMYAHVPLADDEPYGVGAVLMAFEEAGAGG